MSNRLIWTDEARRTYIQTHHKIVGECWIFTGPGTEGRQRGYLPWARRPAPAVYELYVGSIPTDYEVAHLCRQGKCINPKHLKAMTHQEHVDYDKDTKTCENGHPRTPENAHQYKGRYWCRVCRRIAYKRRQDAKKQQQRTQT